MHFTYVVLVALTYQAKYWIFRPIAQQCRIIDQTSKALIIELAANSI